MDMLDPLAVQGVPQRTSRNWSEDIKRRAIAAHVSGTRITDISRKLNVPRRTLRHWITNNEDRRLDHRVTLTREHENELFERMQRMSEMCHYSLTKENLAKIAYDYCLERSIQTNFVNGRASLMWLNAFLQRNKHLGEVYFEKMNGEDVMLITDYEEEENINFESNDGNSMIAVAEKNDIPDADDYGDESESHMYREEPGTILSPIQELQLVNRIQNYTVIGDLNKSSLVELTRNFFKENHVLFLHKNESAEEWVDNFMERYKTELLRYEEKRAKVSDGDDSSVDGNDSEQSNLSQPSTRLLFEMNTESIFSTRKHKKRISNWNETHMNKALAELKKGHKILPTARRFNIPRQTLTYRWEKELKASTGPEQEPLQQQQQQSWHSWERVEIPSTKQPDNDDGDDDDDSDIEFVSENSNNPDEPQYTKDDSINASSQQSEVIELIESSDDDYDEDDDKPGDEEANPNGPRKGSHTRRCRWDPKVKLDVLRRIKNGESSKSISRHLKIPNRTIRNWKKDYALILSSPNLGRYSVLTDQQEYELIERIKNMHNGAFNVTKQEFLKYVYDFCEENKIKHPFKNGQPGRKWYINFKSRHPEVSFKSSFDVHTPNELTAYYENLYNDDEEGSSSTSGYIGRSDR